MITLSQITIEDLRRYRDDPSVSQSQLKALIGGGKKDSKKLLTGSVVDMMLTTDHLFDELFVVMDNKKPSDSVCEILDSAFNGRMSDDYGSNLDNIVETARRVQYQERLSNEALRKTFSNDRCESYWNALKEIENGKQIVSLDEIEKAAYVASMAKMSSVTAKYLLNVDDNDRYYQVPIYWFDNVPCKGLLDMVIVEHDTKTVYIVDVKTTSSNITEWFSVARSLNYPFQMAFYRDGWGKQEMYWDYDVKCRWIVINTSDGRFEPYIVECTEEMLNLGRYGGEFISKCWNINGEVVMGKKKVWGYKELIDVYEQGILSTAYFNKYQGKITGKDANDLFFE